MYFPNHEKAYCLDKWLSDAVFGERTRIIPGFDRLLFCIYIGPCPNLSDLVCIKCITKSPQIFSAYSSQRCLELRCVKIRAGPMNRWFVRKNPNSHSTRCSQTLRFDRALFQSSAPSKFLSLMGFQKYIFSMFKTPSGCCHISAINLYKQQSNVCWPIKKRLAYLGVFTIKSNTSQFLHWLPDSY